VLFFISDPCHSDLYLFVFPLCLNRAIWTKCRYTHSHSCRFFFATFHIIFFFLIKDIQTTWTTAPLMKNTFIQVCWWYTTFKLEIRKCYFIYFYILLRNLLKIALKYTWFILTETYIAYLAYTQKEFFFWVTIYFFQTHVFRIYSYYLLQIAHKSTINTLNALHSQVIALSKELTEMLRLPSYNNNIRGR